MFIRTLIFCVFCSASSVAQVFNWTENCRKAYGEITKLNFSKAQQYLNSEKKANSENLIIPYIESEADFIRCFISESKADLDHLKKENSRRIDQVNSVKINTPYKRLLVAEYNLQLAVARIKFEELIGAVYETRKAFRLLEENQKQYPNFKTNLRGLGFIHSVVGAAPGSYQWMMNLLGFSGTIKQGISELRELLLTAETDHSVSYLKDELIVMLTFLEMNLTSEKNDARIRNRFAQVSDISAKPLLLFAKGVFHFANAENDSVLRILSERKPPADGYRLFYLDYMEANARLNKLDYSAEVLYNNYVNGFKGKTFILSSYQRLGWIRLLQHDDAGYKFYMDKILKRSGENTVSDEDKQAVTEAESGIAPNVHLLRSRLLFDGGYYNRSMAEITGVPPEQFPSLRDKLEFTYRLARIYDKTNNKTKAIQYYMQTLNNGKNYKYYFAANSALMLGLLYETSGDIENAEKYFRTCLSMRDHEYQNSLDQKAKAGLNRIGKSN